MKSRSWCSTTPTSRCTSPTPGARSRCCSAARPRASRPPRAWSGRRPGASTSRGDPPRRRTSGSRSSSASRSTRRTSCAATATRASTAAGAGEKLTVDHVMPRSRGGPDHVDQRGGRLPHAATCYKGNRTLEEARLRLIREPVHPQFLFSVHLLRHPHATSFLDSWRKYLVAVPTSTALSQVVVQARPRSSRPSGDQPRAIERLVRAARRRAARTRCSSASRAAARPSRSPT